MLDAAQREVLQKKNIANVAAKLHRGGTLTAREQAILAGASGESGYCSNLDELGAELGVDRRTLANAKRRFAKAFGERKHILERADGRYHIASWREFLDAHGVTGRAKMGDEDEIDERQIRLRTLKYDLDRKEHELQKSKDLTLAISQFEAALGTMLSSFNSALNALPGRTTPKLLPRLRAAVLNALRGKLAPSVFTKVDAALSGPAIIDFADVEEILVTEIDIAKRALAECDYLKQAMDEDLE